MTTGTLIKMGGNLEDPRNAKASDFPAVGPMGAAGMAEGAGKLVSMTKNQEGPRNTQDSGDNTPSVWGKDGEFKVSVNKGMSQNVKCDWGVDLMTGAITPDVVKYPA